MTINDIQNVTYEKIGTVGYRITANDGYCIHLPTHEENEYTTIIIIPVSYDLTQIEVLLISSLPADAVIYGGEDNNNHEIM